MDHICVDEISFHPHSYGDPDGRLFWWNGDLYRGISHDRTPFFQDLFRQGILQKLVERGVLVDSEPVPLNLEGYGMVLRHRCIPFVSYPHEWCAPMFKSAALAYLDLVSELARAGLVLKDTHPWNLLFEGCQPVYVDLTSIKLVTDGFRCIANDKFYHYYVYPLLLMSQGQERLVRHLLPDYEGISRADFDMLTQTTSLPFTPLGRGVASALKDRVPKACRGPLKSGLKSARSFFGRRPGSKPSALESIHKLKDVITNIPLPESPDRKSPSLAQLTWPATENKLNEIIAELRPRSILAVGRELPDPAETTSCGSQLVYFDGNSTHISRLYHHAFEKKLPLLPLVIDFTDPTPSRGLSSHLSISAAVRLRCELVIVRGLVKRLVAERHLRFDQIVDGAAELSKRWLMIDYAPFDSCERAFYANPWYTMENFIAALRRKFMNVNLVSYRSGHEWLLCEK